MRANDVDNNRRIVKSGVQGTVAYIRSHGEYGTQVTIITPSNETYVINHLDEVMVRRGQRIVPDTTVGIKRKLKEWWYR